MTKTQIIVDKRVVIDTNAKYNRAKIKSPINKLLWFMLHEGILMTYRKVMSTRFHKELSSKAKLIIVFGIEKESKQQVIAIGLQENYKNKLLSFYEPLILPVEEKDADKSINDIYNWLMSNKDNKRFFVEYTPYNSTYDNLDLAKMNFQDAELNSKPEFETVFEDLEMPKETMKTSGNINKKHLFLIGCGSYSWSYILPMFKGKVHFDTCIDLSETTVLETYKKFNFSSYGSSYTEILETIKKHDNAVVVIATYHSTHFNIANEVYKANPSSWIFIEKPPITTLTDLDSLIALREQKAKIEIGYNRRYARNVQKIKEQLNKKTGPTTITCIVKEIELLESHWYYWPNQGTRVTGNLCHWLDLCQYFIDAEPVRIYVDSPDNVLAGDEAIANVFYSDGSKVSIVSSDYGNDLRGVQEFIDIRKEDVTIKIDDFLKFSTQEGSRSRTKRYLLRDKGHKKMYKVFIDKVLKNQEDFYPNKDLDITSKLYIAIVDQIKEKVERRNNRN